MSYHIYSTKGLVLSQRPLREADRVYSVLTRDFGLVQATALGVRKSESKIRGQIEPFVLTQISLVKGKEYWRITSAELIKKFSRVDNLARPLKLVEKLIQGEANHPELFDDVEQSLVSFDPNDEMSEINLVSKTLYHLGYLKESDLKLDKKSLIKAINAGLEASQLY